MDDPGLSRVSCRGKTFFTDGENQKFSKSKSAPLGCPSDFQTITIVFAVV